MGYADDDRAWVLGTLDVSGDWVIYVANQVELTISSLKVSGNLTFQGTGLADYYDGAATQAPVCDSVWYFRGGDSHSGLGGFASSTQGFRSSMWLAADELDTDVLATGESGCLGKDVEESSFSYKYASTGGSALILRATTVTVTGSLSFEMRGCTPEFVSSAMVEAVSGGGGGYLELDATVLTTSDDGSIVVDVQGGDGSDPGGVFSASDVAGGGAGGMTTIRTDSTPGVDFDFTWKGTGGSGEVYVCVLCGMPKMC